jgi:MarR family transcriptional regulator, organic hydroperoxide resistance regulator
MPTRSDGAQIRSTTRVVQSSFPQIYLACHTRHQRKRSSAHRLSARDGSILSHLDRWDPITPAKLAAHLGVSPSTLSEALKRLSALGLVAVPETASGARRKVSVVLTEAGAEAISDTSVLETARLEAVLAKSTAAEMRAIEKGLSLLAAACRHHSDGAKKSRGTPR